MYPKKDDPQDLLIEAMVAPEGVIERSEKRGQTALVSSEVLPRICNVGYREELKQMGIVFGDYADDMFIYATLPEGWKKEATDHSMWSKLFDDQGRERASIFYKAAFYDRSAFITVSRRFNYSCVPVGGWENVNHRTEEWTGVVLDSEKVIWRTEPIEPQPSSVDGGLLDWYKKKDDLANQAKAWLDENYSDWENRLAYWD